MVHYNKQRLVVCFVQLENITIKKKNITQMMNKFDQDFKKKHNKKMMKDLKESKPEPETETESEDENNHSLSDFVIDIENF